MANIKRDQFSAESRTTPLKPRNADVRAREYLTKVEVRSVINAAKTVGRYPQRDALMILMTYRHALRAKEVCSLEWQQIDWDAKTILIKRAKGGVESLHFLGPDEVQALRKMQKEQRNDEKHPNSRWIFVTERGGAVDERTFRDLVVRAGNVAELEFPIHPHMLRHAKGFELAQKGTDTRAIQHYMGHKNISSTVVYTALDPSRFRDFCRDDL